MEFPSREVRRLCREYSAGPRMEFPSRETVERLRREYSAGPRMELSRMDDAQAPPVGTKKMVKGMVMGVDDTGSLLMCWDNGSGLNVVYGVDVVRKV